MSRRARASSALAGEDRSDSDLPDSLLGEAEGDEGDEDAISEELADLSVMSVAICSDSNLLEDDVGEEHATETVNMHVSAMHNATRLRVPFVWRNAMSAAFRVDV